MAKYELMLLIDPKEKEQTILDFAKSIFPDFQGKMLEKTELAYPINNSKTGKYFYDNVEANQEQINEFKRKIIVLKTLWRYQIINLDKEIGIEEAGKAMERHAKRQAERKAHFASRESRFFKQDKGESK